MCLQIFKGCEALGGCIIFLDELDSLATSRDQGDMHEASRRLLGVLLREIDGFNHRDSGSSSSDGSGGDSSKRSVVIGATNRRQDLDAALLSRCAESAMLRAVHQIGIPVCMLALPCRQRLSISTSDRSCVALPCCAVLCCAGLICQFTSVCQMSPAALLSCSSMHTSCLRQNAVR